MADDSATEKHVLVVDDEPDFAALLRSMLLKAGYRVTMAHNCEDALLAARKQMPDLITLDIHMPRKSGVFFYRKLKEDEKFRRVPVVVVTGITRNDKEMETIVRTLLEPNKLPRPHAYLEKPVSKPLFLRTVEEALQASS